MTPQQQLYRAALAIARTEKSIHTPHLKAAALHITLQTYALALAVHRERKPAAPHARARSGRGRPANTKKK